MGKMAFIATGDAFGDHGGFQRKVMRIQRAAGCDWEA